MISFPFPTTYVIEGNVTFNGAIDAEYLARCLEDTLLEAVDDTGSPVESVDCQVAVTQD